MFFQTDPDFRLLVRYVAGDCDERERHRVRALIAADDERGRQLDELSRLYAAYERDRPPPDADAAWAHVAGQLPREAAPRRPARPRARPARSTAGQLFRVAAVLAAVVVTAIVAARLGPRPAPTAEAEQPQVFTTPYGQRAQLRLGDGTRVHLNVGSELTVPPAFATDAREVWLRGEAFFEVATDAERPFIVHAGLADVRVLGTAFAVRAYAADRLTHVAVAEGRVRVAPQAAPQDTVVLRPRDALTLMADGVGVERGSDLAPALAWMDGRLVFENAPFHEVERMLERWYDLDVDLVGPAGAGRADGLTATFADEPLSEILNAIATALGLDYERSRRHVTFYATGPAR